MKRGVEEEVILVNRQNQKIGTALKSEVHHAHTPLHRGFSLYIWSEDRGGLLLQKRSGQKKAFGGYWGNSCCGHPLPGIKEGEDETGEQAARRRAQYELGIDPQDLKDIECVLPDFWYEAEDQGVWEREICPVYSCTLKAGAQISPNDQEVSQVRWVSLEELLELLKSPQEKDLSPWTREQVRMMMNRGILSE